MSAKYTPGPWEAKRENDYCPAQVWAGGRQLAEVYGASGESSANARLMAAAPDLKKLASHIMAMADDSYLTGHPEWVNIALEAVAILAEVDR